MRKIEAKMIRYHDAKLAGNGAAQFAVERKDARSVFVYALEACVGIREQGGNNRGPLVSLIQDTVGGPDAVAWCMSLIQTGLAYAEKKTGVKSPLVASEHCLTTWQDSPRSSRVKAIPARGAIAIWQKGTSSSGHTGIVLEYSTRRMKMVEGNTESGLATDGSIQRDGGGVYLTDRGTGRIGTMRLLGFLKPF